MARRVSVVLTRYRVAWSNDFLVPGDDYNDHEDEDDEEE